MHLPIGYRIGNHYEIIKILGQGGFGIVYLVKDLERLDEISVIKELFAQTFSFRDRETQHVYNKASAEEIFNKIKQDIIQEVNILRQIDNPNIVKAYGYIEENGTTYSIMEYIDGIDLGKYATQKTFTEEEAKDLLRQLINGLKDIHAKNIIHRDIKPNNIIRNREGIYKIIDFSTNKRYVDGGITTVTAFQNPIYTAPELTTQKETTIGKFSDIYSIGMTLLSLMSNETLPSITDRLINDDEFQNIIRRLDTSEEFKEIIVGMTKLDYRERYQDLVEIERLIKLEDGKKEDLKEEEDLPQTNAVEAEERRVKKEDSFDEGGNGLRNFLIFLIIIGMLVIAYLLYEKNGKSLFKIGGDQNNTATSSSSSLVSRHKQPSNALRIKKDEESTPSQVPTKQEEEKNNLDINVTKDAQNEEETSTVEIVELDIVNDDIDNAVEDIKQNNDMVDTVQEDKNTNLGERIEGGDETPTISLGERIGSSFTQDNIKDFLLNFIVSGENNDPEAIIPYYADRVRRYFNWTNVTKNDILDDKKRLYRRWEKRRYRLIGFTILKTYFVNGVEYCDLKRRMSWEAYSPSLGLKSGVTTEFITIKSTREGFKIVSIYTIR